MTGPLTSLAREPEDAVCVLLLCAIFAVMILSVIFRYVLNDSLVWAEEFARFGLIVISFAGSATGFRRDSHIRIDLADMLPAAFARPLNLLVLLVSLATVGFLALQAVRIAPVLANSRSAALEMPMAWLYAAVAAGLAGAMVRILMRMASLLRGTSDR